MSADERYESVSCAASLMVACEPLLRRLENGERATQKAKKIPPLLLSSYLLSFNLFTGNTLKPNSTKYSKNTFSTV